MTHAVERCARAAVPPIEQGAMMAEAPAAAIQAETPAVIHFAEPVRVWTPASIRRGLAANTVPAEIRCVATKGARHEESTAVRFGAQGANRVGIQAVILVWPQCAPEAAHICARGAETCPRQDQWFSPDCRTAHEEFRPVCGHESATYCSPCRQADFRSPVGSPLVFQDVHLHGRFRERRKSGVWHRRVGAGYRVVRNVEDVRRYLSSRH
jgi:hypothetical protein